MIIRPVVVRPPTQSVIAAQRSHIMHSGALNASSERPPFRRLTIIVAGMIAGDPGTRVARRGRCSRYLLGLRQLGHDVHFIEPVRGSQAAAARYEHCRASANAAVLP